MNYNKFCNITIAGLPGNGSTTLLHHLLGELAHDGWRGYSGSEYMREYALIKGYLTAQDKGKFDARIFTDEDERMIDYDRRYRLVNERLLIIESWLSGFMAQLLPNVLKVLMTCSSDYIRSCRVAMRECQTLEAAARRNADRFERNMEKWRHLYAREWDEWVVQQGKAQVNDPIDFYRPDIYDLVIDTYSEEEEEVLRQLDPITLDNSQRETLASVQEASEQKALRQVLNVLSS